MKPTREMLQAIVAAYRDIKPGNAAGGSLHIVVDDGNFDDSDIEFCREYAAKTGDDDGVWLANVFLSLTLRERIELFEYHGTQLTSMEEHWLEPTREYVLQRRAHWISQKEQDPDGFEHYMFDEAIKECDDWLRTPADVRRLAFFLAYGY